MKENKAVTKAIILAAGWGTRLLPISKGVPKEMFAVIDKPVIQLIVEELVGSGIKDIVIVTNPHRHQVEDYFGANFELEKLLKEKNKVKELEILEKINNLANIVFIQQKDPKGSGDAVLQAKNFIKPGEPFIVIYVDDLWSSEIPRSQQLINYYNKYNAPIISVANVSKEVISRYGVIKGQKIDEKIYKVESLIEKPKAEEAPSTLASLSGYLLFPEIFDIIENTKPTDGEVYLADAIDIWAGQRDIYALELEGKWLDIGGKDGYIKAIIELALKHPEIGKEIKEYLENLKIKD